MKIKLTTLILFVSIISYSQNFSDEYLKKTTSGNKNLPAFLQENLKKESLNNIQLYKNILLENDIEIDELKQFFIIDEKSQGSINPSHCGVIVIGNKTYSFTLTDKGFDLSLEFLLDYNSLDKSNSKSIIFYYVKNNKFQKLSDLAKKENEYFEKSVAPKLQYEVIVYNNETIKKLELMYLHDFIIEIIQ